MGLLAGTNYDPAVAVTKATDTLIAMTAFDTTNLRLTFTAPPNGIVRVRMRCPTTGASTAPQLLFSVLDGATVRGRQAPFAGRLSNNTNGLMAQSINSLITGLTPGTSYTWDAAYGVEFAVASSNIKYGGPNLSTANDAAGGFGFEIWDTPGLLAGTHYDPASAVTKSTSVAIAITAFDTTNLRLTFTAPPSGNVFVRHRCMDNGANGVPYFMFSVLDGATVRGRSVPIGSLVNNGLGAATDHVVWDGFTLVTGLVSGTSYTWDAAYGVEQVQTSSAIKYGGPDNATQDDAYGGFSYEIWDASTIPVGVGMII